MRKLWITSEPMPVSAETLAAAHEAGVGEIIHRPLPRDIESLADGFHELAIPDAPAEGE